MTLVEINQLFTGAERLAIIGGKVSGNLECLDFDFISVYQPFLELLEARRPGLAAKLLKRQTPSGGFHLIYRCTNPVSGNMKLACTEDNQVMIETRGEGGYFLSAPSPGYKIIEGSMLDCPVLSPEDVEVIHGTAKAFDQRQRQTTPDQKRHFKNSENDTDRPGDRFNRDNEWRDLLDAEGWVYVRTIGDRDHYTRPGKQDGGTSATVDPVQGLYVFSTNTPLPSEKPLDKFAFYTFYHFGGDFSAAARSLAGDQGPADRNRNEYPPSELAAADQQDQETTGNDIEKTLEDLAKLSSLEYEKVRKQAAKEMGVRATELDKVLKAARKKTEADTGLPFEDTEPWHKPIDPAILLEDIAALVRRFIICEREVSNAVALWCAMTWFMDVVQVAPLAIITAPEKRCGKTLLLTILGRLSARSITASSISPAALYRAVEAWKPTLLIDEADACLKDNEELRGIINSGHSRDSAYVIRTVGDDFTPTKFSTWGAKAISGIGHVAETLMDRAVILELRRKLPNESVERIRQAEPGLFDDLRAKLARFAVDYSEQVRKARPYLPQSLNDRAQDNWEPLLAIASVAGDEWLKIATETALKISGSESVSQSIGVELLTDIQEIFETKGVTKLSSADLIKALCEDDEKPWATYNRGQSLKPRQLAARLKGYSIVSKNIRLSLTSTPKGFEKKQFEEAFSRYIPSFPPVSATTPQTNASAGLGVADVPPRGGSVADKKMDNLSISLTCGGVADRISPQTDSNENIEVFI